MEGELAKLVLNEKLCREEGDGCLHGASRRRQKMRFRPVLEQSSWSNHKKRAKSEKNSAPFTRNRIVFSVKLSTIFILCLVLDALLGSGTTNKDLSG